MTRNGTNLDKIQNKNLLKGGEVICINTGQTWAKGNIGRGTYTFILLEYTYFISNYMEVYTTWEKKMVRILIS